MSRPPKPQGAHLIITQIRIPGPLKRRIEALAEATGYAQQEHMRRALDEYVLRKQQEGAFQMPVEKPRRVLRRPSSGMLAA
jgi:predicted DNA-binding protein